MTFSHKTVNILFHTRKFLSGKDALNTLCGTDNCRCSEPIILLQFSIQILTDFSLRNVVFILSLYAEVYTKERLILTQNI